MRIQTLFILGLFTSIYVYFIMQTENKGFQIKSKSVFRVIKFFNSKLMKHRREKLKNYKKIAVNNCIDFLTNDLYTELNFESCKFDHCPPRRIYRGAVNLFLFRHSPSKTF